MATATGSTFVVKVTLSHATELPASDFNGKSDPFVTLKIDEQVKKSSCRPATCDPTWTPLEQFDFTISDPELRQLDVLVYDHDLISTNDLLGGVTIPLRDFVEADDTKKTELKSFPLQLPKKFQRKELNSLLYLSLRVVPVAQADCVQEMWENEHWKIGSGWISGTGHLVHHRAHWSSEDGRISSHQFEMVAPKTPEGFESDGWSFVVGKGDAEGWFYATTFAGPWYNEKNFTTMVRRRKWVSACRRTTKADGSPRHTETLPTEAAKTGC